MSSDQPQQPAPRRFFFPGLDPVKYAEIERELEEREQLRRARASAVAVPAMPAATRESEPTAPGAMDWGAVAEGLRGLASQLRRAAEGPGPSPG
jgi:hypothetical protein